MLTLPFILLVLITLVSLAALFCHLLLVPVLRAATAMAPEVRSYFLLLVAAAPWLIGTGVLLSSIADILFGACDFGNACLWNQDPSQVDPRRALVVVPLLAAMTVLTLRMARRIRLSRQIVTTLDATSARQDDPCLRLVPTGAALAFSGGGRIFVSSGLKDGLSPEEYQAVLLHERAHLQRRDGLLHVAANLLSACYLPPFRHRLLDALALANEEACDRRAATVVGRRATASAILAVERIRSTQSPATFPGFADGFVAERVRRLLAEDSSEPRFGLSQAIIPLSIIGAFLLGDVLYYLGMLILYPAAG